MENHDAGGMTARELRPIGIDVLYEGVVVDFAIYSYQDGKSVLLCKDTVLDKKKLEVIREAVR